MSWSVLNTFWTWYKILLVKFSSDFEDFYFTFFFFFLLIILPVRFIHVVSRSYIHFYKHMTFYLLDIPLLKKICSTLTGYLGGFHWGYRCKCCCDRWRSYFLAFMEWWIPSSIYRKLSLWFFFPSSVICQMFISTRVSGLVFCSDGLSHARTTHLVTPKTEVKTSWDCASQWQVCGSWRSSGKSGCWECCIHPECAFSLQGFRSSFTFFNTILEFFPLNSYTLLNWFITKCWICGLSWWLMVKDPPANAGDVGSIPGWKLRFPMPRGN